MRGVGRGMPSPQGAQGRRPADPRVVRLGPICGCSHVRRASGASTERWGTAVLLLCRGRERVRDGGRRSATCCRCRRAHVAPPRARHGRIMARGAGSNGSVLQLPSAKSWWLGVALIPRIVLSPHARRAIRRAADDAHQPRRDPTTRSAKVARSSRCTGAESRMRRRKYQPKIDADTTAEIATIQGRRAEPYG